MRLHFVLYMKKSVLTFVSVMALSISAFAGNCGFHNLVGEWTKQTILSSTPDAKCGDSKKTERTVFSLSNKGGKVSGLGLRKTIKTFENKNCSPKMETFEYPSVELISNGSLSIVSENGAQVVSNCDVNSDRSQLKIGTKIFQRTK